MTGTDIVQCHRVDDHEPHQWFTSSMPTGLWHFCGGKPSLDERITAIVKRELEK